MKTNRFGALMLVMLAAIISWSTANAQSFTVKGIVTDAESGEAIIGCSVVIDGTRNGTATGTDGTRRQINRISKLPHGPFHSLSRVRAHSSSVVNHVRYGLNGDISRFGHVFNRYAAAHISPSHILSWHHHRLSTHDIPLS